MSKDEDKEKTFDKSKYLFSENIEENYESNVEHELPDNEEDIDENYDEDTLNYIKQNIIEYLEYHGIPLFEYLDINKIDKFLDKLKL